MKAWLLTLIIAWPQMDVPELTLVNYRHVSVEECIMTGDKWITELADTLNADSTGSSTGTYAVEDQKLLLKGENIDYEVIGYFCTEAGSEDFFYHRPDETSV